MVTRVERARFPLGLLVSLWLLAPCPVAWADAGRAVHKPDRGHLSLEAEAGPADAGRTSLVVRLMPEEGWHLYPIADKDSSAVGEGKPTLVGVVKERGVSVVGMKPKASGHGTAEGPPADVGIAGKEGVHILPGELELEFVLDRSGPSEDAEPRAVELLVGFQTCNDTTCDPPWAARLTATFPDDATAPPELSFDKGRYAEVARNPFALTPPPSTPSPNASSLSLPVVLAMGLVGGLILNLMPCVLPVLGLKLMAFAQQSGRARREIFAMNLWYLAGLYAVFFVLATASVAANLGLGTANLAWGEQFTSTRFNVVMCSVVFAFALSFLGVWELPIPGFIGERAGQVQSKEGPLGAFLKGALSTVLATPCSGPFLGPVFGFTLSQPTVVTYAVFAAIATGMAVPYLVIGFLPGLARFLPKPGAWMELLKEILGFVMLGTVVFLFTFLDREYFVPTLALLFGIWAGCWWVGRGQAAGSPPGIRRWTEGIGVAATVGGLAFAFLGPVQSIIPWEPFSRARLAELKARGATVLVDFSADWCLTCKLNLATAIETNRVKAAIEANRIVPLLADWTEESSEIKTMLESLQSKSIPVLAVFPATEPGKQPRPPIILRDLLSESQVLDAIEQAGPSRMPGPEIQSRSAQRGPPHGSP